MTYTTSGCLSRRSALLGIGAGVAALGAPAYVKMTTFENLLVAAIFGGRLSQQAAHEHCSAMLEQCGQRDKANCGAGSLSLLDRKRLELARAMAARPKLRLLDEIAGEPTDGEAEELVALIRHIRAQGVGFLWIEHVLHAVLAVADLMIILEFGAKIAEWPPRQIMDNPEVRRVYMGIAA